MMCIMFIRSQDIQALGNDETEDMEWAWRSWVGIEDDHTLQRKEIVAFPPLRGEGTWSV